MAKNKNNKLLVLLFLSTALLGGCNKEDDSIKIKILHAFGHIPQTGLREQIAKFESLIKEHDGVDIKIEDEYGGGYKDLPGLVRKGFSNGDIPTICVAYPDHVADYMYEEGSEAGKYVVNLQTFMNNPETAFGTEPYLGDNQDETDIIESYLEEGRCMPREGTYLLPLCKSTEIMTYNLDAAKMIVPEIFVDGNSNPIEPDKVEEFMSTITWDQLIQIATYAKQHTEIFPAVKYPIFYDSDSNLFITEMYQKGIPYSSVLPSGMGKIEFEEGDNLVAAKAMVQQIKNWHDAELLTTKGMEGGYASTAFKNMETFFSIGSTGGTGYSIPAAGQFDVGFAKVPAMGPNEKYISQGASFCLLNNPSISSDVNALKLKYAWKFAKFITSSIINTKLCQSSQGYSPVRTSCYSTESYLGYVSGGTAFARQAQIIESDIAGSYFTSAVFKGSGTLRDQVGGILTAVCQKENASSIDNAFASAISNTKNAMA